MTQGWLPEGFENQDVTAPGRVAVRVSGRIRDHRRRVRVLRGGMALTALALILGAAPALWRHVGAIADRDASPSVPQQVAQIKVDKPTWAPEAGAPNSESGIRNSETKGESGEATATSAAGVSPYLPISPSPHPSSPHLPTSPSPYLAENSTTAGPEVTVGLSKAGKNVELAWTGSPQKEYVVYRCTTPKFDKCSIAGTVKGTQWNDTGSDNAPVVFYKVEPKA